MKNKFTNVYLEILNTTLQFLKLNWAVFSFGAHSRIFLVGGSSLSTETPKNQLLILAKHRTQFPSARRSLFDRCEVISQYDVQYVPLWAFQALPFLGQSCKSWLTGNDLFCNLLFLHLYTCLEQPFSRCFFQLVFLCTTLCRQSWLFF